MIRNFLVTERFSVVLTIIMLGLAAASLYADCSSPDDTYWFQRSRALIVLTGAALQYVKLVGLWNKALDREMSIEPVESRIASGKGIDMLSMANQSVQTREFAIRIHETLTEKSVLDVLAVVSIVAGTIIWAYGDLPFKNQGPTNHSTGPAAKSAAGR